MFQAQEIPNYYKLLKETQQALMFALFGLHTPTNHVVCGR